MPGQDGMHMSSQTCVVPSFPLFSIFTLVHVAILMREAKLVNQAFLETSLVKPKVPRASGSFTHRLLSSRVLIILRCCGYWCNSPTLFKAAYLRLCECSMTARNCT